MACLGLIVLVNAKGTRLFQFPFLFSGVWIAFVLVDFLEFIDPRNRLFQIYSDLGVIDMAFFVMVTAILGGFLGYMMAGGSRPPSGESQLPSTASPPVLRRLQVTSCVVATISYTSFLFLAKLSGGLTAYIFYSGAYTITWEGLPVYLVFLVRFGYVAIVIQLWLWSRTGRASHLRLALFFSVIPFINIFFLFRRSEVLTLGIFFGYFFVNYTRLRVRRLHAVVALAAMLVILRVFPLLRNEAGKSLSFRDLFSVALAPREYFADSEIGSGLLRIYYSMSHGAFEYGAIFWNAVVRQFIPSGLVGPHFKASLMLPELGSGYSDVAFTEFHFYVSPMGFAQAYQQFWIFGGLIFFIIGYLTAGMEQRRFRGPRQEVFLVLMLPALVSTVSADLSFIVTRSITYAILVMLCIPSQKRVGPTLSRSRRTI